MEQNKYIQLYNSLEEDIEYTAKMLGISGATCSAMCRRGLLECIKTTSPKIYRKSSNMNSYLKIKEYYDTYRHLVATGDTDYVSCWEKEQQIGVMYHWKNDELYDSDDKKIKNYNNISRIQIGHFSFNL